VLANGGLGAILVLLQALLPDQIWPWAAFAGAMAAVNADTWSTELGILNRRLPRSILNGRPVEPGTSGAISCLGSLAAFGGAALVGLVSIPFTGQATSVSLGSRTMLAIALASIIGGVCGSFFDSFLGATFQGIYFCPRCQKETERYPRHACDTPTSLVRGWRWLDNDLVNFACSLVGAGLSVAAFYIIPQFHS
jgi:uncharacterized protein (TIGR00297 family)